MNQEDPRILELRRVRAKAKEGGGEERSAKQCAKGKLTARERIEALLDPGTFNKIEPFIAQYSGVAPKICVITRKAYGEALALRHQYAKSKLILVEGA